MKLVNKSFVISILMVLLSACSSDSEDSNEQTTDFSQFIGTWNLVEYNISPAQDINEDNTASSNLKDELSCLSGVLTINNNQTWNLNTTSLSISFITNDLFIIDCSNNITNSGNWTVTNGTLRLSGGISGDFSLFGNTLRNTRGEDLPSYQSVVYEKQ